MLHGLTLLSGILIVLAFPPWDFTFFIWIGLIPWLYHLKRLKTYREVLIQGVWLSALMSFGGFYWVATAIHHFGNLPWTLSILCLVIFAIFNQPQLPLFACAFHRLYSRSSASPLKRTVFFTFLYCALDWISPRLFTDTLGNAFHLSIYIRQSADIGGVLLLTFFIVLVNLTLWELLESICSREFSTQGKKELKPLLVFTSSILIAVLIYGYFRNDYIEKLTQKAPTSVQAAIIQANIGDFDKVAAENGVRGAAQKVLEAYYNLSERALAMSPKPDFLVWPETAYPSTFRTPMTIDEMTRDKNLEKFVKERGVPLLFGGYDRFNHKDHNAFFFLNPKNKEGWGDLQTYRKYILLPFGEYIPGASSFSFIRQKFPQVGNFGLGDGPSIFQVPIGQSSDKYLLAAPLICYEALFPKHTIEGAKKGGQLILNITNDSWFGPFGEPQLHFALTVFRGIETRLPQLRATNTGISALVSPTGEVIQKTEIGGAELMNVKIPLTPPIFTLMKALGEWFGKTSALVAAALYLVIFKPKITKTV